MRFLLPILASAAAFAQAQLTNLATAQWTHEADGSESVFLRNDPKTGGMDLLVRYPAGHIFKPHKHESNERIIVLEGQLTINGTALDAGGVAFLPAGEAQRLACTSKTRCTFYLAWDGKPKSFPAP
jgi:quercetin dioxygenase-like cupin family protein